MIVLVRIFYEFLNETRTRFFLILSSMCDFADGISRKLLEQPDANDLWLSMRRIANSHSLSFKIYHIVPDDFDRK